MLVSCPRPRMFSLLTTTPSSHATNSCATSTFTDAPEADAAAEEDGADAEAEAEVRIGYAHLPSYIYLTILSQAFSFA